MVCRAARNDGRVLDVSRVLAGALLFAGTVVVAYVLLSLLDGTAHASTVGSAVAPPPVTVTGPSSVPAPVSPAPAGPVVAADLVAGPVVSGAPAAPPVALPAVVPPAAAPVQTGTWRSATR